MTRMIAVFLVIGLYSAYSYSEDVNFDNDSLSKLDKARSLLNSDDRDGAKIILIKLDEEDLPSGIRETVDDLILGLSSDEFDEGMSLYEKEEYLAAKDVFEGILKYDPWDKAQFMSALCDMKLGRNDLAIKNFKSVVNYTLDNDVKRDAEFFIRELSELDEKLSQPEPMSIYIKVGGGYNSNVYIDGRTESPEGKPEMMALAGLQYRVSNSEGFSFEPFYSLMWDEIIGDASLRFINHVFDLGFSYDVERWSFALAPQLEYQHFDQNADVYKPGIFMMAVNSITDSQELGFTYNLYNNITNSTYYDYLKGNEHAFKFFWGFKTGDLYLGMNYGYYIQNIGDIIYTDGSSLPFGYKAHGPELRAEFYPSDTWSIYMVTSYLFKGYDSVAMPDNKERNDRTFSLYTEFQKTIAQGFKIFVLFNSILNYSTLDSTNTYNENYSQYKVLGGIKWELQN